MYDIAIIGGGPSGATLAKLISHKYKVLLVDKKQPEEHNTKRSYDKCCGGLLSPDAQKILAKLGIGLPKEIMVDPQIFVVRTIDLYNQIEKYYQRFYFNLDRAKFDRWLMSLVPKEVDVKSGYLFKNFNRKDGYFDLNLYNSSDGKWCTEKAKIIIGADGGSSLVRKQAFKSKYISKYISIQEWFEAKETMAHFSAIFDSSITDFYSWTIPKNNHIVVGSALRIDDDPVSKFQILKDKLRTYGYNLDNPIKKEGAFILRPCKINNICTGDENIALVGEAAGWISPSSAEGFSYAFHSAYLLAESLKDGLDNFSIRYARVCKTLKRNIMMKNLKSPIMYNNTLRKMAMGSNIQSVKLFESNR